MASDIIPPSLVSINIDAAAVTITGAPVTLTVTAHITDNESGLFDGVFADGSGGSPPQIRFRSPSGQFVDGLFDVLNPVGGNRVDGSFEATLTLGNFAEAGTWTVEYLLLADEAGNFTSLYPETSSQLSALTFAVTNANSDATPPALASISISDSFIDIDAGERTIIVTARFTDNLAGLFDGTFADGSGASGPQIRFISPSGQIIDGIFDIENPVSGTITDGVFRATMTLDLNAEPGDWTVQYLLLVDEAGNMVSLYPETTPALAAAGFTVKNAAGDAVPPTIQSITFGNPTLNPDGTSQFVVEAHLKDNLSGLSDGMNSNGIGSSPPQVRFVSGSGQIVDGVFDMANPVSGNLLDGVFRATVTLSAFAETGVWRVEYVLLSDEAGNFISYYPETSPQIPSNAILLGSDLADTFAGTSAPESIYGFGGNDTLNGNSGDDTLNGGAGDDTVNGGTGNDEIVGGEGAGNDKYVGGKGVDTVIYKSAVKGIKVDLKKGKGFGADIDKDKLKQIEGVLGGQGADVIKGDKGANVLDGFSGKDKLTGGAGKDAFVFSTALGKNNVDTIKDFRPKDDTIHLDDAVFAGLTIGRLKANQFHIGSKAKDAQDRIIYDDRKGLLILDANGEKKGGETVFARLDDDLAMTHKDFLIV